MAQLMFLGASTTQGVGDSEGGWVDRLKKDIHKTMYGGAGGAQHSVFNLGISGNTTTDVLERLQAEIEARKGRHGAEMVFVVSVGLNDSRATERPHNFVSTPEQYIGNLQAIVDKLKNYGDKILFVGLTPNDDAKTQPIGTSYFSKDRSLVFDQAMTQVADHNEFTKVDIFKPMLAENWKSMLFADGLHPNANGHAFIANRVRPELWKLLAIPT